MAIFKISCLVLTTIVSMREETNELNPKKAHLQLSRGSSKSNFAKAPFFPFSLFFLGLNNPAGMMKENQSSIAVKRGELYFTVAQPFSHTRVPT